MKKSVRRIIAMTFASAIVLGGFSILPDSEVQTNQTIVSAAEQNSYVYSTNTVSYTYTVHDNEATITKINISDSCSSKFSLCIPSKINGYTVKKIGSWALSSTKFSYLSIPNTVTHIEAYAFDNTTCPNLRTVVLPITIQEISEAAFGNTQVITTAYVKNANNTLTPINYNTIDSIANNIRVTLKPDCPQYYSCFSVCSENGTMLDGGMMEILNAISNSPLSKKMTEQRAKEIVSEIIPANATELQKMQIIYDYVITTVRYCALVDSTGKEYVQMRLQAFGSLFFHSGLCAGMAQSIEYLGKEAGLDVRYFANPDHAWNIFKPTGKDKYYLIDATWDVFCDGIKNYGVNGGKSTQVWEGVSYELAPDCLGSSILVQVDNRSGRNFEINLSDRNIADARYCSYTAVSPVDTSVLKLNQLLKNKDKYLYMYSHAYYRLEINDENGTEILDLDYALSKGNGYSTTFKDTDGNTHTCQITIDYSNDPINSRTDNNARFVIKIT